MNIELFPFQIKAVEALKSKLRTAVGQYIEDDQQQIISLQAPTGSGKTIIMTAFIEALMNESYDKNFKPVVVWLSDSPELNEQSKQKMECKANGLQLDQYITIESDSFDKDELEAGFIYFLNTQKLAKSSNLVKHSDKREYTIWETFKNTINNKNKIIYFIIDEAHRGTFSGHNTREAMSIMQKFIKGCEELQAMPIIIGMSATADRFNKLVESLETSVINKTEIRINTEEVRKSGLLKDRIIVIYPDAESHNDPMLLVDAVAQDWQQKCEHWKKYKVDPVLVIQVKNRDNENATETDINEVLNRIIKKTGYQFKEYEVVQTFEKSKKITACGILVHYINPSDINNSATVRIVFFKENLSTGWDCPRAETMLSFRAARDVTYIAQLFGRMIRTPLQRFMSEDGILNDVRLFLPFYDKDNVKTVVDEIQNSETGRLPADFETEKYDPNLLETLTLDAPLNTHENDKTGNNQIQNQGVTPDNIFDNKQIEINNKGFNEELLKENDKFSQISDNGKDDTKSLLINSGETIKPDQAEKTIPHEQNNTVLNDSKKEQLILKPSEIVVKNYDVSRKKILKFINNLNLPTYKVSLHRTNSYLVSLANLVSFLTTRGIDIEIKEIVQNEIIDKIHAYALSLEKNIDLVTNENAYVKLSKLMFNLKLDLTVFDAFGKELEKDERLLLPLFSANENEIYRQWQQADRKLGSFGIIKAYVNKYYGKDRDYDKCRQDCIFYVSKKENLARLEEYAEQRYRKINSSDLRRRIGHESEECNRKYDKITENADLVSSQNFHLPDCLSPDYFGINGDLYKKHLYARSDGDAAILLNSPEKAIINKEINNPDVVCWLRNLDRKKWSLSLVYEKNNNSKTMFPDFLVIRKDKDDFVLDILEPHGDYLADNLGKAKALAKYVREEKKLGRVLFMREHERSKGVFRCLDMNDQKVRDRVLAMNVSESLEDVFRNLGFDYSADT